MNKLWAPWRIKYITQKKIKGCIFCRIRRSTKDATHHIVMRSQTCFVVLNTYPYNNGHLMVVTNRHIDSLDKLKTQELNDMMKVTKEMTALLAKTLSPQGYNVGLNIGKVAGAGVAGHLHMHIVPRWEADTNFMPVVSNTKIVSQSLHELYSALTANLCKKQKKK